MELRKELYPGIYKLLCLFIFLVAKVTCLQQFTERPQDLSIVKGQTALLRCAVANRVGMIQWGKGSPFPIMLGFNRTIQGYDGRYSIIGNDRTEHNLQILNTVLDDDDDFQCQVGPADNNPPLVAKAHLSILVPPNFPVIENYENSSVIEVPYNKPVLQLVCMSTQGRPAASLKWFRNSKAITEDIVYEKISIPNDKREDAKSTLRIEPRYPEDNNAEYSCQAFNDAMVNGPNTVTKTLNMLYPPGKPVITGYKVNQAIRVNDTIQLICTSEGGNPLAQVAWYRNNAQVDFSYITRGNKAENELIITAERSDNDAVYRCEAWNTVNSNAPLTIERKILVHFAPKSATITGTLEAKAGETLTLTCTTTNSNPAAVISWIPNGPSTNVRSRTESSPDGGYITISEIDITLTNRTDSVPYICSARNVEIGSFVSDTVTVGVLYPPKPPEITGYNEGESIRAESLVKLRCTAQGGNPPATIKWFKGDVEITEVIQISTSVNPTVEINVVAKANDNGAVYKCEASNKATDASLVALTKLTVHFPPAWVNITSDPEVARAGHRLRLTCVSASSNPAAEITWIHNNRGMTGTSAGLTPGVNGGKIAKNILQIIPKSSDHESSYGCRATNLILDETIHDAIILNVLFKPEFIDLTPMIEIKSGESRIINLTATANPSDCTYVLKRGSEVINEDTIVSFSLSTGVLTISAIAKEDSGDYTITATNSQGSASFDFSIDVQYPAEITEANAVEGDLDSYVELKCKVIGNPMTSNIVTWRREGFDMTRVLPAYEDGLGTLTIESLQKTDSGTFTCVANNGIGDPVESGIELSVKFSPIIDKSPEYNKAASQTGRTGRLICNAEGAPIVTFQWQKDGVNIVTDEKYTVDEKEAEANIKYESVLLIKDVQKSDYGIYQCIVTNEKGVDRLHVNFDDTAKPDPPYDLQFVNATHNSITVQWNAGFNGGLPQGFRVRYRAADSSSMAYTQVDVDPADSTVFTVKGLALGTEYDLTVMAYNDLGGSQYSAQGIVAKTSNLKPTSDIKKEKEEAEDMPVIIILIVCVVGIFLLVLNIGLILFFVRRRKKRMENGSDTTSHTNTIELYGPNKEVQLYPMTPSDESRSYGTYDKNDDDFSDDYKSYEEMDCVESENATLTDDDEDLKRVFLPPPEYGSVTYSHNKLDSPTFDHRHPVHTEPKHLYNGSDTDSCRKSPWHYDDPYNKDHFRSKGTFDSDYPDRGKNQYYEQNGHIVNGGRPKSVAEFSERSSRPSSRGGLNKTPPPPPVRSSSKGAADIPPLPARNYGSQEVLPRYVPPPGSSSFSNNVNVITNPNYEGPSARTPSPGQQTDPGDDMRGYLV